MFTQYSGLYYPTGIIHTARLYLLHSTKTKCTLDRFTIHCNVASETFSKMTELKNNKITFQHAFEIRLRTCI